MADTNTLLHNCLYFTANSLARAVTRMAEEEFRVVGLAPSHAFLLMLVNENPGIGPSALAERLNLAPSTVSRLVESLARKGLLERRAVGKSAAIHPTDKGLALRGDIARCWKALYHRYSDVLGEAAAAALTRLLDEAHRSLEEQKDAAGGGQSQT